MNNSDSVKDIMDFKLETPNKLAWLNVANKTSFVQLGLIEILKKKFQEVIALEIGSAYGGAVETMAKFLKGKGKAYGYDTFVGHPRDLADDVNSLEATCMDIWYENENFTLDKASYEYQRKILDEQKLDNAILVKGRINEHSFDDIKEAHLVMIDLDLVKPSKIAYYAIRSKIVRGGYLLLHDALPPDHLPLLHDFIYTEVLKDSIWTILMELPEQNLLVLQRK